MSNLKYELLNVLNKSEISFEFPLNKISYWKIGGKATIFIEPETLDKIVKVKSILSNYKNIPQIIIGNTSNLLFDDEGFNGVVIKIGEKINKVQVIGKKIEAEAGAWIPNIAKIASKHCLTGLEHTAGIPSFLGGLIYMNGGSQRKSISDSIHEVTYLNELNEVIVSDLKDLDFNYRQSPFQNKNWVILKATLILQLGDKNKIRSEMLNILSSRRKKFPRKLPSCGSVFESNPIMYEKIGAPGFIIEKLGLKGKTKGDAQISPIHANFIVNNGKANSRDILYLIKLARDTVYKNTGYLMESEARHVLPNGEIIKAHISADKIKINATDFL